jgi:hypothetical protein
VTPLDVDVEAAPQALRKGGGDQGIGMRRQPRVRVQEEQRATGGMGGAGVHLHGPAPWCADEAVATTGGALDGIVAAPAIGEDQLVAAAAQRGKRLERCVDALRLVQSRDDDRDLHRASFSDQSYSRNCRRNLPSATSRRSFG